MGAWEEGAGARGARRGARRGDGRGSSAQRGAGSRIARPEEEDEAAEGRPEEEDEMGVELNQMASTCCKNLKQ